MEKPGARPRSKHELRPSQLRRRLDPGTLPFRTTKDVEPLVVAVA